MVQEESTHHGSLDEILHDPCPLLCISRGQTRRPNPTRQDIGSLDHAPDIGSNDIPIRPVPSLVQTFDRFDPLEMGELEDRQLTGELDGAYIGHAEGFARLNSGIERCRRG